MLPLLIVCVTVALGALLALLPRGRSEVLGPIRTFALTAACSVVAVHFLPHALQGLGPVALLLVALGVAAPHLAERLVTRVTSRGAARVGLEAGYAGLVAHKLGDGLALGAAAHDGIGPLIAIGAHNVPMIAFVVLAFSDERGHRSGLLRALGLGLASAAGVLFHDALSETLLSAATPAFDAVVAGLLLHVVAHELGRDLPRSTRARAADWAAALVGLALVLLAGGHAEHAEEAHGHAGEVSALAQALLDLALASAPALLAAVLVSVALRSLVRRRLEGPLGTPATVWRRVFAQRCGCDAELTPDSAAPRAQSTVFGGLVPSLTWVALALAIVLLGVSFVGLWLGVACVLAVVSVMSLRPSRLTPADGAAPLTPVAFGVGADLDELIGHVGLWFLVGWLAAAELVAYAPLAPEVGSGASLLQLGALALSAPLIPPCPAAAVPLAAALGATGIAPGALLTGLLLAPALKRRVWRSLIARHGGRAAGVLVGLIVLLTIAAGWLTNALLPAWHPPALPNASNASPLAWTSLALLGALLLRAAWQRGLRGWLSGAFDVADHAHAQANDGCSHECRCGAAPLSEARAEGS
jgi:hypothetical protein